MMTRREAIKTVALTAGALAAGPSLLQGQTSDSSVGGSTYPFKLAPLGYPYDALEPYIDALTMQIHHDKHNGAYVENLNKAIAQAPEAIQKMSLDELLRNLDKVPENIRTAVRNNAGGQYNHSFFWKLLKKNENGKPTGELATAIDGTFGSYSAFQDKLSEAAPKFLEAVGHGWSQTTRNSRLPRRQIRIFLPRKRIRQKYQLSGSTFGNMPTTSSIRIVVQTT